MMTGLRLLSVAPTADLASSAAALLARLTMLNATILTAKEHAPHASTLTAAVMDLAPDVVLLHGGPQSALALDVSQLCSRRRHALVLHTALHNDSGVPSLVSTLRARRTLARTDAVVARSAASLAAMRRLGFAGYGIVAGGRTLSADLPSRAEARHALDLPSEGGLVLGWAGTLGEKSGILEMLEALALRDDAILVVPGAVNTDEVVDRADALEILDRVRFARPESAGPSRGARPVLAGYANLLAAVDALVVAPATSAADQIAALHDVELARACAVPVIHDGSADLVAAVGNAGWSAAIRDPGLLAGLLARLSAQPGALLTARMACAVSDVRQTPEAAAAELGLAIRAAHQNSRDSRVTPRIGVIDRLLGGNFKPSRT